MKRLLLLGGGHTHLVAGPLLARSLPAGWRVSLLAPSPLLLYSGMMPGWLAGQYRFDECAIALRALCEREGIEWVEAEAADILFGERRVIDTGGASHGFDLLSINVGSSNDPGEILPGHGGRRAVVIGAKPFADFVGQWKAWLAACDAAPGPRELTVAGGGAAAVEIAFALASLARGRAALAGSNVRLATAGDSLLAGQARIAAAIARRSLLRQGVRLDFGARYLGVDGDLLRFEGRPAVRADLVVVATGARPPAWLARAARRDGVAVADDGGLAIDSSLRSTSTPSVWAAGDCASFVDQRVPKAGVHALRQGPALAGSIRAAIAGGEAPRYVAQRRALALLNRCDGSAIGAWGPVGFAGAWAWRWKDRIDRGFMARFPSAPADGGAML